VSSPVHLTVLILHCLLFFALMQEKLEFVEGKVDWKGRQALKNKHGGLWASLLILGMYPIFILKIIWILENNINYILKPYLII